MKPSKIRAISGLLALGVVSSALDVAMLTPSAQTRTRPTLSRTNPAVELRLRRTPGQVDVVIEGLGTKIRAVSQKQSDSRWSARLTGVDLGDRPFTPQQALLSSSELFSVQLEPLESDLQLIVKARMGERVPTPTIGSNGDSLVVSFAGLSGPEQRSSGRLDLRRPGRVAQPVMVPPIRPRASAPPLGDIAVGTMLINNRSFVNASGPPVSLTLNQSPAKDALMSLARLGGYGFVFVGDIDNSMGSEGDSTEFPVTMTFRGERYDRALNSVLMASGLQGRLDRNTLLVGTAVSAKSFGPQMSKVFRMNQVDVASASKYLGNLGASITVTSTRTAASTEKSSQNDGDSEVENGEGSQPNESTNSTLPNSIFVETYSSEMGPLIGLMGTTDSRLNTITLVGDPKLISVAEGYLRQIDLRKRQVAVKVQILNVTLDNNATIDSSFSAKIGNTFIVSQSGKAHMNFGAYKPGAADGGTGMYSGDGYQKPGMYDRDVDLVEKVRFMQPSVQAIQNEITGVDDDGNPIVKEVPIFDDAGRPVYWPHPDPNEPWIETALIDPKTGKKIYEKDPYSVDRMQYPKNSFYSYIESVIISSNAKTLAQPTLLVQEGQKALVRSGESVITGVNKNEGSNGSTQFSNTREDAGLTVNLEVEKIDDNGFITLKLDPTISVPISAGQQEGVQIFNIVKRELNSGRIRLRDRQTLILTGVIQESDRQLATKWPILGDLPLIGQLFRSSSSSRQKNELVIIVTPSVLDDGDGGVYGYGYRPGTTEATRLIGPGSYP